MDEAAIRRLEERITGGMVVENMLNRAGDQFPMAYYHPETEGKLMWIAGIDREGKCLQMFVSEMNTREEQRTEAFSTQAEAIATRDVLLREGWLKVVPPRVTVRVPGMGDQPLNRKQRRYLSRNLRSLARQNPFDGATEAPPTDDGTGL